MIVWVVLFEVCERLDIVVVGPASVDLCGEESGSCELVLARAAHSWKLWRVLTLALEKVCIL